MNRKLALLFMAATAAAPLHAQQRVRITVALQAPTVLGGPPVPLIATPGFALDNRWGRVLEDAIPLRLRFRLELWRSRALNDALERRYEWEVLLRIEPLFDQLSMTVIQEGLPPAESRVGNLEELGKLLTNGFVVPLRPRTPGVYYYSVTVSITPLSDSEMAEYERFLGQGDQPSGGNRSSTLGRTTRRFLLRIAGLPSAEIDGRSETFSVTVVP